MIPPGADLAIVLVGLPRAMNSRFHGILCGEEELATMRHFDTKGEVQELWTTQHQKGELLEWLNGLPALLGVRVVGEKVPAESPLPVSVRSHQP